MFKLFFPLLFLHLWILGAYTAYAAEAIDTDGDGISDEAEVIAGTDPLVNQFNVDPDWSLAPAFLQTKAQGFWDFESYDSATKRFYNRKYGFFGTAYPLASADAVWSQSGGLLGKCAAVGYGSRYIEINPDNLWDNFQDWNLSFSFKLAANPAANSITPLLSVLRVPRNASVNVPPHMQFTLVNGASLVNPSINGLMIRVYMQTSLYGEWLLPADFDPSQWNNIAFNSGGRAYPDDRWCVVNGTQLPFIKNSNGTDYAYVTLSAFFEDLPGGYILLGATKSATGVVLPATVGIFMDRLTFSNSRMNVAEMSQVTTRDTDGDGASDHLEVAAGMSPARYDPDFDGDGLTGAEELAGQAKFDQVRVNGVLSDDVTVVFGATNPNKSDTDMDGFLDDYEAKFFRAGRVDPNNPNFPARKDNLTTSSINEADYDADQVTNYEEWRHGTDPHHSDSDGDGASDLIELEGGSSPTDKNSLPLIATIEARTEKAAGEGKVRILGKDNDGDGLSDLREMSLGTADNSADTDGDGLSDSAELLAGSDPLLNDLLINPDGIGLNDLGGGVNLANGLRAVWGFESIVGGAFPDTSGNGFHAKINGTVLQGAPGNGPVNRTATFDSIHDYIETPLNVTTNANAGSVAFWFKASSSANAERVLFTRDSSKLPLYTVTYIVIDTLVVKNGVNVIEAVGYFLFKSISSTSVPSIWIRVDAIKPGLYRIDDGSWHHVVFSITGNNVKMSIDGVTPSTATNINISFFARQSAGSVSNPSNKSAFYFGALSSHYAANNLGGSLNATIDQLLIYDRAISANEAAALFRYDTDGDGTSNSVEIANGTDPYSYSKDQDRDGLTDAEEQAGAAIFDGVLVNFGGTTGFTKFKNFNSDGSTFDSSGNPLDPTNKDLFDDYWEAKYYSPGRVDPNDSRFPALVDNPLTTGINESDYDGDGLSNFDEFINGTDPEDTDTDNDDSSDKVEVDFGLDPNDPSERPLNPSQFEGETILDPFCQPIGNLGVVTKPQPLKFLVRGAFGDGSGSHSERWRLKFNEKGIVNQAYGKVEPFSVQLNGKDFWKVSIEHVATKGDPNDPYYPNYDYNLHIDEFPGFILCDDDAPEVPAGKLQGDFLINEQNLPDGYWNNKSAYLVPTKGLSSATSFNGNDAVGPRHRKVALNGRPMTDEKPEQEEESDVADEETYIDAFNQSLRHNTSFNYVPLGASDLVLQATASIQETSFSDRSGLLPHERLDLPFGAGWSSNLCSYIEVVETLGDESDDPVAVNVIDESGNPQRFGTKDFQNFFPWPSSRVDNKTYLNTLSRNGTSFTLQKKFGSTLTYTASKAWFLYSTDRKDGSDKVRRHTYWRLSEVQDRYGVRLQYKYGTNEVTLIPQEISSPDRVGQFLSIQRSADCRRIKKITDSRGNATVFHYNYDTAVAPTNPPFVFYAGLEAFPIKTPLLQTIDYADGTSTAYAYDSVMDREIDDSVVTNHFYANVDSIEDKRGNVHGFTYGFDHSKRYFTGSNSKTKAAIDLNTLPRHVKACVEKQLEEQNDESDNSSASWKTMYGLSRRVTRVDLPGGEGFSQFAATGRMDFAGGVNATDQVTTVVDATGNSTVYQFTGTNAELVDVDRIGSSTNYEWMVYYLASVIYHGGLEGQAGYIGKETYEFDLASGLSLRKSTDMSGNVTTWEHGEAFTAPHGLDAASGIMTKWADPTAKIDALGRREEYEYSSDFRVMSRINDPYGTVSAFSVDGLGRRMSKDVLQAGSVLLQRERYDYNNQLFKAFQTATTTVAFAKPSGQDWEDDLKTVSLPDSLGRLWRSIVDPNGEKLVTENSYDFNNNKTSTLDARGKRTRFKYDKLNRLTEITFPSAGTRAGEAVTTKQIWYDENGNKAAEIDEEGKYTIHHYDALNRRITTIRDMDGAGLPSRNAEGLVTEATKGSVTVTDLVTRMEYNAVGSVIRMTDPRGIVTRTFYDSIQRPIHVFTGLTAAEAAGNLAACTATAAASTEKTHTEFSYDLAANSGSTAFDSSGFKPTQIIRHDAVLTATGTIDLHTTAVYDKLYRATSASTEYESGQFADTTHAYGTITGGKETRQTTVTDARGKITRTLMDGLMRPTSVTDAFGTPLASTTQTFYSSTGLVWKTVDPLGRVSETEYDRAGRPVTAWMPDPLTGLVNRATPADPLLGSPRTQTFYDKNGNVTATINPLGNRWEFQFDARNRKTLETQPFVTETKIVSGVPQETASQIPRIKTAYDGAGNVISITDPRGNITRNFYDNAYRVTATLSNPVNGNPSTDANTPGTHDIKTTSTFDPNGNPLVVIDGNGNATRNSYDLLNRLSKTATNPSDGQPNAPPASPKTTDIVVTNLYDDSGNLVKVTDGENRVTGFRWDGMSRKTRTIWDEGSSSVAKTESATYDGLVQLTRTDPKAQVTTYQYDALHRLENTLYTGATVDNRHFDYDLVGNLLDVTYPNETAARKILRRSTQVFDKLNRLTSETSAGVTHVHSYDKAGNRRTTNYGATARNLVNTYDKLNRLLTLTENGSATTSYGYDLGGNVTKKTLPNGSASLCTFDALNRRLTETSKTSGGGIISAFDYSQPQGTYPSGYDKVGNVLKFTETYGRADVKNRTVTNVYDRVYRLSTETAVETAGSTITTTYGYDKNNNRTQKIVTGGSNPGTWTSVYGTIANGYNSNQLESVTKSGGVVSSFLYDLNGNRSSKKIGTATVQTYGYDFENRLITLTDSTKGTFSYSYDHRTRRVGRDESSAIGISGLSQEISFAGGQSVQEFTTGSSLPTMEYIRGSDYGGGIGGVLYTIRSSARSYNAYNSRGDVVSKTDDSNTITWQAAYEAFGTRTQEQGATLDRQKANTKDEDPTGLLNEGMRYRDLEFGVFLTRDPMGFVDGPNVYTYVRQNPWTFFDPDGLAIDKKGRDRDDETGKWNPDAKLYRVKYNPEDPAKSKIVPVSARQIRDKNAVIWINGMANNKDNAAKLGADHTGKNDFYMIHNPSNGGGPDFGECGVNKFNAKTRVAVTAADHLKKFDLTSATVTAHSQGTMILRGAMMKLEKEGKNMGGMKVQLDGAAAHIGGPFGFRKQMEREGVTVLPPRGSPFDAVHNIVGMNTANPLRIVASLLAAPLLFTDRETSPHGTVEGGILTKKFGNNPLLK